MKYGSVCSGIEAATVAWHPLGWTPAWFAEIEQFPSAVLFNHYPAVPNLGDMTTIAKSILTGDVEAPDVLVGGTPCQAFSVAGLRKSLDDERGQLSIAFIHLADAIDAVRCLRGEKPAITVWENVPGVLNTGDNAFGCFLAGLAGEECELQSSGKKWTNAGCVYGPKRTVAWRVLDAQYFGVAQRRRRVFVVASARDGFNPESVLFELEGVRRDTAPSRKTGQEVAAKARTGTRVGFDAYQHHGWRESDTIGTLTANLQRGVCGDSPLALDAPTYGIPGNWIGRKPENGGNAVEPMHDVSPCLTKTDRHGVAQPVAFQEIADSLTAGFAKHHGASGGKDSLHRNHIMQSMAVRRLTPIECERLQGFPDNYTNIPWRKSSESPDGPRYKALGNSMAVPVMAWIGKRIDLYC